MKTSSEASAAMILSKINVKLANKGTMLIFAGYAKNHARDYFKMWYKASNTYYLTPDVVFLH